MKKIGIAVIIISIMLCFVSISYFPARSYEFDPGDMIKMTFITGSYLLLAIFGSLLLILDKLKKK